MKYVYLGAIIAILGTNGATEALASGVGLRQYQPAKAVSPVCYDCPTGECQSGAPCSGCKLRGFACVDGATPPPCTADGACTPNRATFGFNKTRWRRWPGDTDSAMPTPSDEATGDSLLTPFDTPEPEEEDQQAPPPIEDDPGFEEADELPPLEIDLPPLPEQRLDMPAARPLDDEPPALPFGAAPARSSMPSMASDSTLPALPTFDEPSRKSPVLRTTPVSLPNRHRKMNTPPALPEGFTQQDLPRMPLSQMAETPRLPEKLRRLPEMGRLPQMALKPSPRVDTSVRPATAIEPLLLQADR